MTLRHTLGTVGVAAMLLLAAAGALRAQPVGQRREGGGSALPTDSVYQGRVRLPDFQGRDRKYASYRTRISEAMVTGPDFAGHYAVIQIGCGTGCRFVYLGDVATGQVYDFPYGGEDYGQMQLNYSVKSPSLTVYWINHGRCIRQSLQWTGRAFEPSSPKMDIGAGEVCERL